MVRSLAPLALVLSTSALAQTYSRPEIVRGLCQPDGCSEFAIVDAQEVARDREGTLLRTRLKTFHASREGRKSLGEEDGYVYCSPTRPAILADQDGRTMAFLIAPFASAESREAARTNGNYHAVYFAICHGPEAGWAAVRDLSGVAESLGYEVSLPQSRTVTLNRAEDVMAGRESRQVHANRVMPPPLDVPATPPRRDLMDHSGEPPPVPAVPRQAPPAVVDREEDWLEGPRQLTDQALEALDQVGRWGPRAVRWGGGLSGATQI